MRLTASGRPPGRFRLVLITSLIVGMVFLGYYVYFQAQLEKVHTRNLRLLATMSTQIEQTLLGYSSVIDSLYRSQCKDAPTVNQFLNEQTSIYPYQPDLDKYESGRHFRWEKDEEGRIWFLMHAHGSKAPSPDCATAVPIHGRADLSG